MVVTRLIAGPVRLLLGEDIFISYARADGTVYANNLAAKLARLGFACRIDQWETTANDKPPPALRRALLRCRMLVLVATPCAGKSKHVQNELEWFQEIGGNIIPIDLGGLADAPIWGVRIKGIAPAKEEEAAKRSSKPSLETLRRITSSARFVRLDRRLRYGAITALVILVVSLAAATWLSSIAGEAVKTAADAQAETQHQQGLAKLAQQQADLERERAGKAQREADSMAINMDVMEPQNLGTSRARWRAARSIVAYRNFPLLQSAQLLAEATMSCNHYVSRFKNPDEAPVVSRNGRFAGAWNRKNGAVTVYRLGDSLVPIWRWTMQDLQKARNLEALAVSNDGRHVGINLQTDDTPRLYLLEGEGQSEGVGVGHEIFRDSPAPGRNLIFDDLTFSSDGRYLTGPQPFISLEGPNVADPLVYDLSSPALRRLSTPLAKGSQVSDIQISDDSTVVGVVTSPFSGGGEPKTLSVYTLPGFQFVNSFQIESSNGHLAFTPSGSILLGSDPDKGIYSLVDDWRAKKPSLRFMGLSSGERFGNQRFIFFPDGHSMALFGELGVAASPGDWNERDSAIVLADFNDTSSIAGRLANNREYLGHSADSGDITSVGVTDDGGHLVTTDAGGMVTVWETRMRFGVSRATFDEQVTSLVVPQRSPSIYVADLTFRDRPDDPDHPKTAQLYRVDRWQDAAPSVTVQATLPAGGLEALSPDARWWANIQWKPTDGNRHSQVIQLHALAGDSSRTLDLPKTFLPGSRLSALAFSPNGDALVGVMKTGETCVWDLTTKQTTPAVMFQTHAHFESNHVLAFTHDGTDLVIAYGRNLSIWRDWKTATPRSAPTVRVPDGEGDAADFNEISISARDAFLAASTGNGTVMIWDGWRGGRPALIRTFKTALNPPSTRRSPVLDIDFNPWKEGILSILDRQNVRVMDVQTGDFYIEAPRHIRDGGASVRFSKDGRYLISTAFRDKDYVIWLWNPNDLIADACSNFIFPELLSGEEQQACQANLSGQSGPRAPSESIPASQ